jgi:purine-nucleoside phosphorylase
MSTEFHVPSPLPPVLAEAMAALAPRWAALDVPAHTLGVILGSGLGPAAEAFPARWSRSFEDLGLTQASVAGHAGRLLLADGPGAPLLFLQGRLHRYEGLDDARVLLPAAALAGLGLAGILITNAAGGLDPAFAPGDFMLIDDILSLQLDDPLRGLRLDEAPRRPPRRPLFTGTLAETLVAAAGEAGVTLHRGTLTCATGPSYETRAEVAMTRALGAQAASMSTYPESMLLARLGHPAVAMSCITNAIPAGDVEGAEPLTHDEVVEVGRRAAADFGRLLAAWSRGMGPRN